jgi:hypothetical protein
METKLKPSSIDQLLGKFEDDINFINGNLYEENEQEIKNIKQYLRTLIPLQDFMDKKTLDKFSEMLQQLGFIQQDVKNITKFNKSLDDLNRENKLSKLKPLFQKIKTSSDSNTQNEFFKLFQSYINDNTLKNIDVEVIKKHFNQKTKLNYDMQKQNLILENKNKVNQLLNKARHNEIITDQEFNKVQPIYLDQDDIKTLRLIKDKYKTIKLLEKLLEKRNLQKTKLQQLKTKNNRILIQSELKIDSTLLSQQDKEQFNKIIRENQQKIQEKNRNILNRLRTKINSNQILEKDELNINSTGFSQQNKILFNQIKKKNQQKTKKRDQAIQEIDKIIGEAPKSGIVFKIQKPDKENLKDITKRLLELQAIDNKSFQKKKNQISKNYNNFRNWWGEKYDFNSQKQQIERQRKEKSSDRSKLFKFLQEENKKNRVNYSLSDVINNKYEEGRDFPKTKAMFLSIALDSDFIEYENEVPKIKDFDFIVAELEKENVTL